MEYAKSLIKGKSGKNQQTDPDDEEEAEESWTFVGGDEPDPDMVTTKLSEGLPGLGISKDKALGSHVLRSRG